MKTTQSKIVGAVTATMLLVCSLAFSEADPTTKTKPASSPTTAKTKPSITPHRSTSHTSAKSKHSTTSASSSKGKKSKKTSHRGQQKIDSQRAEQIQDALIRQHYMSGTPTGNWDAATEDALRKFQSDNGWQNKTVPDSRALIKLGLGPNHDHLLNPESAMTTAPESPHSTAAPASTPVSPAASPNQPQP